MSYHPGRILPPGAASRKRKEMEAFYASKQPQPTKPALSTQAADMAPSNRLLAGYMAYEFLTKGTILGQSFDPARAEAVPVTPPSADWKRMKVPPSPKPSPRHQYQAQKSEAEPESNKAPVKTGESYYEVTNLLKTDGAHVPGIVNPAQISRYTCETDDRNDGHAASFYSVLIHFLLSREFFVTTQRGGYYRTLTTTIIAIDKAIATGKKFARLCHLVLYIVVIGIFFICVLFWVLFCSNVGFMVI